MTQTPSTPEIDSAVDELAHGNAERAIAQALIAIAKLMATSRAELLAAGEYWNPMQRCISLNWGCDDDLAEALIDAGYIGADEFDALMEVLGQHTDYEADDEYDGRCVCGKWLEFGTYDMPDHLSAVLRDEGLILTEGD